MNPVTILVGGVRREEIQRNPDPVEGILFRKVPEITLLEERANAVLVVLQPEQSPWEVAETILWALR